MYNKIPWTQVAFKVANGCKGFYLNRRIVYKLIIDQLAPDLEKSITELTKRRLFLITSTGRTATTWLANLLDQASGASVVHEPVPIEQYYHAQALMCPETAASYLRNFRLREMALRVQVHNPLIYGEVNSALRRHIVALRELVPEFQIIHLVRDGRDVVTSILNRPSLTPRDRVYQNLQPPANEIEPEKWASLDRFARACWLWANENTYMRKNSVFTIRFEDITSSYKFFNEQILFPLKLELSEATWQASVARPLNQTKKYSFGTWDTWTPEQQEQFIQICGQEMMACGYKLSEVVNY